MLCPVGCFYHCMTFLLGSRRHGLTFVQNLRKEVCFGVLAICFTGDVIRGFEY